MLLKSLNILQRREIWLKTISALGLTGPLYSLFPHDGEGDPLNVLVVGSGGFGDMLYLTTIVRELNVLLGGVRIVVLHENKNVDSILGANPYIFQSVYLDSGRINQVVNETSGLDIFDLIVEVRYAVSYITPPLSRVPSPLIRLASARCAEWQKYIRFDWPHQNNLFAREVVRRGMNKLDLVGYTANLPINRYSMPEFFGVTDLEQATLDPLRNVVYVTIHHGADAAMGSASGIQTKNLPISTWEAVVKDLRHLGLKVVQLGELGEALITGVDVDLRGQTDFNLTAVVMQGAAVHCDTEGGLVHLARAVGTTSVVAFGPTSVGFFGYPANKNLEPPLCGDCWWTTKTWSRACPRQMTSPECMSHDAAAITHAANEALTDPRRLTINIKGLRTAADGLDVAANWLEILRPYFRLRSMVVVNTPEAATAIAAELRTAKSLCEPTIYVPSHLFQQISEILRDEICLRPYTSNIIPSENMHFDGCFALMPSFTSLHDAHLIREMARCIKTGGPFDIVTRHDGEGDDAAQDANSRSLVFGRLVGRTLDISVSRSLRRVEHKGLTHLKCEVDAGPKVKYKGAPRSSPLGVVRKTLKVLERP